MIDPYILVGDERILQLVDDVFEQSKGPLEYKLYFDHFGWSVKLQSFETKDEQVKSESEIVKDTPWKFGNVRQDPFLPIRLMLFMFWSLLIQPNWFLFALSTFQISQFVSWVVGWKKPCQGRTGPDEFVLVFSVKKWEKTSAKLLHPQYLPVG